jgi:xylulokinase
MRRSMQWMGVKPQTIYLTGGASENNAIAQILADIFNAKVQRLAVTGSVALGAAMRAANISKGFLMSLLESNFCKPDLNSSVKPCENYELYEPIFEKFEALIQSVDLSEG